MSKEDPDFIFKLVVLGDSYVGKTNIVTRYFRDSFSLESKATVGVEFFAKLLDYKDKKIKAQIWDTAGQERYRSITNSYYQGSKGVLIIFDLSKLDSFNNVNRWVNEYKMNSDSSSIMVLVGNKCDLIDQRVVTKEIAETKANQLSLAYFETSAKDNINVDLAFTSLLEQITHKYQVILTDERNESILTEGVKINFDSQNCSIDSSENEKNKRKNSINKLDQCCK